MLGLYPNEKHMSTFFPVLFMLRTALESNQGLCVLSCWCIKNQCLTEETQSGAFPDVFFWCFFWCAGHLHTANPALGLKDWVTDAAPEVEVVILQDELHTQFHQISHGLGWEAFGSCIQTWQKGWCNSCKDDFAFNSALTGDAFSKLPKNRGQTKLRE